MKQKLLERLKLMDDAILKKGNELNQANADLNMLHGCRKELIFIMNMCDESESQKESEDHKCPLVEDNSESENVSNGN